VQIAAATPDSYNDDEEDEADEVGHDDEIMSEHNRMLDTILVEEELLITAHRVHIEETMELVRSEMNLLAEVDQPGSAIDQYVERLDSILTQKLKGVEALKVGFSPGHLLLCRYLVICVIMNYLTTIFL
jgi:hypothetical protein